MNASSVWSRVLLIAGLAAMLIGLIDPLEGSVIILAGIGFVAFGSLVGKSRHRLLAYGSFALVAVGVGAMIVLSVFGGIGGNTGRSMWWGLVILPYPVGWIMGVAGAGLALVESFKRPAGAMQCSK